MESDLNLSVKFQFQENKSIKLDRSDVKNYPWWQDRMPWLLTSLSLFYLLDPKLQPNPEPKPDDIDVVKAKLTADKTKHETDEMLCRGHILYSLTTRLYDVYRNYKTPKEVWDALKSKYKHLKKAMQIDMITELHMASMVVTNDWWLDSGATSHVCNNKALFEVYNMLEEHEEVLMGNHVAAKIMGKGSVELSFTSGKKLTLVNVFHVPDLRKSLISANILCKNGFKIVLEADKAIVSKTGVFVGKRILLRWHV